MVNVDTAPAHIIYIHFKYFREGAPLPPQQTLKQTNKKSKAHYPLDGAPLLYCYSLVVGIEGVGVVVQALEGLVPFLQKIDNNIGIENWGRTFCWFSPNHFQFASDINNCYIPSSTDLFRQRKQRLILEFLSQYTRDLTTLFHYKYSVSSFAFRCKKYAAFLVTILNMNKHHCGFFQLFMFYQYIFSDIFNTICFPFILKDRISIKR